MSRILRFLFPTTRYTARASLFLLALRVLFGVLLLSHGIVKLDDFAALSEVVPDPLGLGSRISLTRAIFGELFCSVGFIVGAFYRLALIPMIFTMCVALFVVHGDDPSFFALDQRQLSGQHGMHRKRDALRLGAVGKR